MISKSDFDLLLMFFETDIMQSINFKFKNNVKVLFSKSKNRTSLNSYIGIKFYYEHSLTENICSYFISFSIVDLVVKSLNEQEAYIYFSYEKLNNFLDVLYEKRETDKHILTIESVNDFEFFKSLFENKEIKNISKTKIIFVDI